MPIGELVEMCVEVYVVAMRVRGIEGRKLVEAVAIGFLDARLFRQVIVVIGWQLDTQSGKGIALVACLLPGICRDMYTRRAD